MNCEFANMRTPASPGGRVHLPSALSVRYGAVAHRAGITRWDHPPGAPPGGLSGIPEVVPRPALLPMRRCCPFGNQVF